MLGHSTISTFKSAMKRPQLNTNFHWSHQYSRCQRDTFRSTLEVNKWLKESECNTTTKQVR